jgi:hypothetical protein
MMKRHIWFLALLPILLYTACQLETPERTQDARFVKQTNEPNCGGFTTVYYQWLKEGKYSSADEAADKAVVDSVYTKIKFGDSYSSVFEGLENGSNPAKIMQYLGEAVGDPGLFYLDPNDTAFQGIKTAIQTIDSDLWEKLEDNVRNEVIPDLKPFQYAIGIYSVFNTVEHLQTSQLDGLHYLLFHHNGELLVAYNPWDGYPKPAYYEQLIQKEPIVHNGRILVPTSSGILLP